MRARKPSLTQSFGLSLEVASLQPSGSVTIGWTEDEGSLGSAAIPRDEYERYVKEGKLRPAQ